MFDMGMNLPTGIGAVAAVMVYRYGYGAYVPRESMIAAAVVGVAAKTASEQALPYMGM